MPKRNQATIAAPDQQAKLISQFISEISTHFELSRSNETRCEINGLHRFMQLVIDVFSGGSIEKAAPER